MTDNARVTDGLVGITKDVEPNDMFRRMVENSPDTIMLRDADWRRVYVSPSCRELLGISAETLLGENTYDLLHPDDVDRAREVLDGIGPDNPSQDFLYRLRHAAGHWVWVEGRYRQLPGDNAILAVLRDVSAQKRVEHQLALANAKLEAANIMLEQLAHADGLTGLANRRHFDNALEEEFRRARRHELPLGLIMLDVDHFKSYNDFYGHLGGDDCLRQLSQCVDQMLRRPGDVGARYGGEEFAMLMPATPIEGCAEVAERVRHAVARLGIAHAASPFGTVTISIGIAAVYPFGANSSPAGLIQAADEALYAAKAAGRDCVRYASTITGVPKVSA